ncbi:MAG TPA: hypothetical protein VKQ29_12135 [Aliidongia sp.]|nr:hypothetical protein [Aliidongia sp.]
MELSATQERELFHATCGGFGLTGVILTARIRVSRLPSRRAELTIVPISTVIEGAAILRSASDEPGGVHAWHDFSRRGDGFGRGHVRILRFASDAAEDAPPPAMPPSRLSADRRGVLPMRLLNRWTLRAINEFYAFSHRSGRQPIDVLRALFPIHGSEAYFYLFGRAGFHETQVIVPHGQLQAYLELVRSMAERFQVLITLGATKFFDGRSELLRFDGEGISVAINIPRDRNAARFLAELDRFVIEAGARPSLIKDSRLSRQVFDATYPESDRFRSLLRAWDPKRRFRSELSDRLGL